MILLTLMVAIDRIERSRVEFCLELVATHHAFYHKLLHSWAIHLEYQFDHIVWFFGYVVYSWIILLNILCFICLFLFGTFLVAAFFQLSSNIAGLAFMIGGGAFLYIYMVDCKFSHSAKETHSNFHPVYSTYRFVLNCLFRNSYAHRLLPPYAFFVGNACTAFLNRIWFYTQFLLDLFLFNLKMKTSCTNAWVISPNSHFIPGHWARARNAVKTCLVVVYWTGAYAYLTFYSTQSESSFRISPSSLVLAVSRLTVQGNCP